ncbi:phosphohistidine phosphatase SixA [Thermodesulfobacteriota bacterium]
MSILLVQHGKSQPKEEDPGQGLSKQGIEETRALAEEAVAQNVQVSRIIHSGKKRALQTAEIYMEFLEPVGGIAKGPGLAPLDDVTSIASMFNTEENLMIVGHLPFMERLVSHLVAGSSESVLVKFQNSGIVCLDTEDDGQSFFIRWTLFPRLDQ